MQAPQSSDDDGMAGGEARIKGGRLSNFNIAISAFAAVAGVTFAGIQTFLPNAAPINVMLSIDPTSSVSKIDSTNMAEDPVNIAKKADGTGEPALQLAALELDGR